MTPVLRPRLHVHGVRIDLNFRVMRSMMRRRVWDALIVAHDVSADLLPARIDTPVLLDLHNVMSRWHRAAGHTTAADAAAIRESRAISRAQAVSTCSDLEGRRLLEAHPSYQGQVFTAPLGVDPTEWPPTSFSRAIPRVVMFGKWDWPPNAAGLEWFAQEVWPRVAGRVPDAEALVAGTGVVARPDWVPGMRFIGREPDLAGLTSTATVVAVPVRGGVGASVKFAESLATGAAVIATADGANGFSDFGVVIPEEPALWANWIVERLERRLSEPAPAATRAMALSELTWDRAIDPIDEWLRHSSGGVEGARGGAHER